MKAENARAQVACGTWTTAPAQEPFWWTGAPKQTLDAAAWNQRPTAGTDHRADHPFIHAAVADQTPINLCLDDP
jgi:hypothetical protein